MFRPPKPCTSTSLFGLHTGWRLVFHWWLRISFNFNNSFIKIYSITLISYAIFNVQLFLYQGLRPDNKIENNLLIQVSTYSWMIRLTAVRFLDFDLEWRVFLPLAPVKSKIWNVAFVVLRHLLAFAFANATRDCAPAHAYSLERRWSSHTFRYGYLVTTSPQSPTLP